MNALERQRGAHHPARQRDRRNQHTCQRGQREGTGSGNHPRLAHVDTHRARGHGIRGGGHHRLAITRAREEQRDGGHDHRHHRPDDEVLRVNVRLPDPDGSPDDLRERLSGRAVDEDVPAAQHEQRPHRRHDRRVGPAAQARADHDVVVQHAGRQPTGGDDHEHESQRHIPVDEAQGDQAAEDHLVALGEIQDVDRPVDQVEAQGDKRVDGAQRYPADREGHVLHQPSTPWRSDAALAFMVCSSLRLTVWVRTRPFRPCT